MKEEKARQGRQNLLDAFRSNGFEEEEMIKALDDPRIENEFHFETLEDLFVGIASRNPTPSAVMDVLNIRRKLKPGDYIKKSGSKPKNCDSSCPIEVPGGVTGLAISLAHCCDPIPGDQIVGYITKGKGISVHRANCPNVAFTKRLVDVSWKKDLGISHYPVDVEVISNDRSSLLADILQVLGAKGVSVSDLNAHLIAETQNVIVDLTLSVPDAKMLADCFGDLLGIKGVFDVKRLTH